MGRRGPHETFLVSPRRVGSHNILLILESKLRSPQTIRGVVVCILGLFLCSEGIRSQKCRDFTPVIADDSKTPLLLHIFLVVTDELLTFKPISNSNGF